MVKSRWGLSDHDALGSVPSSPCKWPHYLGGAGWQLLLLRPPLPSPGEADAWLTGGTALWGVPGPALCRESWPQRPPDTLMPPATDHTRFHEPWSIAWYRDDPQTPENRGDSLTAPLFPKASTLAFGQEPAVARTWYQIRRPTPTPGHVGGPGLPLAWIPAGWFPQNPLRSAVCPPSAQAGFPSEAPFPWPRCRRKIRLRRFSYLALLLFSSCEHRRSPPEETPRCLFASWLMCSDRIL